MFTHAGYLRRVMLICSIMTMTGVHKPGDHLSVGWRVCQLLSIIGMSLLFLGILSLTWLSPGSVKAILYYVAMSSAVQLFLVLLFWWCSHRRTLHKLVRLLATLEREHAPRWRDNLVLLRLTALLAVVISSGLASFLSTFKPEGGFEHSNYLVPMYVPVIMRTSDWYLVVCTLQAVLIVIGACCLNGLTLMLSGLVDSAAQELRRILDALRDCFPDTDTEGDLPATGAGVKPAKVAAWAETVPAGTGAVPGTGDGDGGCKKEVLPGEAENSAASTPGPDVALQLSRLSDRYRLVFQLTSDVAETFSVPVLSLYAITTAILLMGGYLLVVEETDGHRSWMGAYCIGITVCVICLCGISISGSSLTRQSIQLRDVIAKDLWSHPMSLATRQQLQLFMDQTTTPLAIDIWGLFSLQKTSVLSVMSFVLTYFVIMLQMIN